MSILRKQPNVVIIGAGMAGVSAARRLVDAGFRNVLILEAADRIGGRIHTVSFGDGNYPVELGANWIHAPNAQNSTFQIAEAIGALQPYRIYNSMSSRFLREDGVEIRREVIKEAFHIFNRVQDKVYRKIINERTKHNRIITLEPLLCEYLEKELENVKADGSYIQDMQKALKAMMNFRRCYEGDELDRITWEKPEEEYNITEGGEVHIPGGYCQILNHIMKLIPNKSLMLKKEVVEILWNSEITEIKTSDGSTFKADHVIVTSSIGYLKKHHETLFNPKLPQINIDVLTSLELGRVNKIFLEFDQPILAPTYRSVAFA